MVRIKGLLSGITYHQFYFVVTADAQFWPEYPMEGDAADSDGADGDALAHRLAAVSGPSVLVETAIAMGVLNLTLEFLDGPPPVMDASRDWEAVAEVSVKALDPMARIHLLMDATLPPFDLIALPGGSGWIRVRAQASGRSLDSDAVVQESPREQHLLQIWRTEGHAPAREMRRDNRWEHTD